VNAGLPRNVSLLSPRRIRAIERDGYPKANSFSFAFWPEAELVRNA
jgi:hypothetical protein